MRLVLALLLMFTAALVGAPAQARGRDDVMAGAYRCGVIAGDRLWLDCFYGAAQPLRAQLGLPPALQAQLRLAATPPASSEVRNTGPRDEAMAGAARCYTVSEDRRWLDCYYNAVRPVREMLGLSSSANPAHAEAPAFAVRKAPAAPVGGFSDWLGGTSNQRIMARLTSYSFDKYGIFTVMLDNGQVWRQDSGDTVYARWKKPATRYTAVITRGALGSINLQLQGEPHIFKVSRLQ